MPRAGNWKGGENEGWRSEAGQGRGTVKKKMNDPSKFKGYTVHASKGEPQYWIKSDKTNHLAMHKGPALKKISKK